MQWYKFGDPSGRYVGETQLHQVYGNSISNRTKTDEPVYQEQPGEFNFLYGPLTGGLIESVSFDIHTPGEIIRGIEVKPEVKLRTIPVSNQNPLDVLLKIERINGFHSASHSIAFLTALEDAMNIEVTVDTMMRRILMLELERIRSNLEVVKRMCEPAGFSVPHSQIGYLREKVSRIISSACGHRYFFGSTGLGSASIDIKGINERLALVKKEFNDIFKSLLESKIFLNRLQNNGINSDRNLIGPAARAAGYAIDARADSVSLPYTDIGFEPIVFDEPDAFGRFYIRSMEVLESIDIISTLRIGKEDQKSMSSEEDSGEGAARVESPQGDLFYYVVVKDGLLEKLEMASPSLPNISAFRKSVIGNIFTDFHFNWESFGIWISEAAVMFR